MPAHQTVWKQIPFVVLTTSRENKDIEAAYQFGVNSYIVKPVDFPAFAEVVKTSRCTGCSPMSLRFRTTAGVDP